MTSIENKYKNGKIYKICSSQCNDIYIGSTVQHYLSNRFGGHKQKYLKWLNDKKCEYVSSFEIIKHSDAKIILLEKYNCNTKDELRAREQWWIDNTEACVNKQNAYTSINERKSNMKIYQKNHYEKNLEKSRENSKKHSLNYYYKNQEAMSIKRKKYYEMHKEQEKEKARIRSKEIIKCETCNITCSKGYISRHNKSEIHLKNLNQQPINSDIIPIN